MVQAVIEANLLFKCPVVTCNCKDNIYSYILFPTIYVFEGTK